MPEQHRWNDLDKKGWHNPMASRTQTTCEPPRIRPPRELVDTSEVEDYGWTDHVFKRCPERGIGVFEVLSAIADPETVREKDPTEHHYIRGDLRVVVNPIRRSIVTVIDLFEDERSEPRKPLNPLHHQKKGSTMPRRNGSTALDEAWVLTPHDEEDYRRIDISPALAEKLLATNPDENRPTRRTDVDKWKAKMESGEFVRTHQGMAMDSRGMLGDGKHRLTASSELGRTINVWMLVGAPPENFQYYDSGRNRTSADLFSLLGESDTNVLGAVVRLTYLYLNALTGKITSRGVSNPTVLATFHADPEGYRRAIRIGTHIAYGQYPMGRVPAAAGVYLLSRVNRKTVVEDFSEGLISGAGVPPGDARLVLGRTLNNRKPRTPSVEQLAWFIKAFNAWAEDASIRALSYKKSELIPRVTKVERVS